MLKNVIIGIIAVRILIYAIYSTVPQQSSSVTFDYIALWTGVNTITTNLD